MPDLYSEDAEGLMGLCMLAGIVQGRVSEEEYEDIAYYCLLVIDNVLDIMEFPFPSLEKSARYYRAAGVGIVNLAYELAKNGLGYTTKEGKEHMHRVAERHSYCLHKASLRLAKEFGVCGSMEVSKYPEGWLPIDTYNKHVDNIVGNDLQYDWEKLRADIIDNGGIRNSVLEAIAPNESSSQLTNTCNSIYPIRQIKIAKGSGNNRNIVIAPESDKFNYDIVWEVDVKDQIETYAIFQKFIGQGISGDFFIDRRGNRKVSDRELLQSFLYQTKSGMKTRYYMNTRTGDEAEDVILETACEGGGCTL